MKPSSTSITSFSFLLFAVLIALFSGDNSAAKAQSVVFRRITSSISDDSLTLSRREEIRVERFLKRVYPTVSMQHVARNHATPALRKASYDVVQLRGVRYALVAYVAEWNQPDALVHDIAIYRFGADGPIQVWRSPAWIANYYGLTFETAATPSHMLILFKEGGLDPSGFSLSGVLSFRESDHGLVLHDLTPRLPYLYAVTHFPSRALYGKKVVMQQGDRHEIILSASDEEFVGGELPAGPTSYWHFNPRRGRFEGIKPRQIEPDSRTTISLRQH